jgi:hypothetical protein
MVAFLFASSSLQRNGYHPSKIHGTHAANTVPLDRPRKCAKYAVAFWGYLRGSLYTSEYWQHYIFDSPRLPSFDSFWYGPEAIMDNLEPSTPASNVVTDAFMLSLLGSRLTAYASHALNMSQFASILTTHQIPNEFPLIFEDKHQRLQYASRTLSALTNIAHVVQLTRNHTQSHCDQPYTHVLLTRMDLLLYGYPVLPVTPSNMVLFSEGNGFDLFDNGEIQRRFMAAPQFDPDYHINISSPHFNDQLLWIPWAIFEKLSHIHEDVLNLWRTKQINPNMETTLYQLLKQVGLAEFIFPFDMVPYTIYRGPGSRLRDLRMDATIPYIHQASIEKQSQGWVDQEQTCPIAHRG